jgi:hypothetical protein
MPYVILMANISSGTIGRWLPPGTDASQFNSVKVVTMNMKTRDRAIAAETELN